MVADELRQQSRDSLAGGLHGEQEHPQQHDVARGQGEHGEHERQGGEEAEYVGAAGAELVADHARQAGPGRVAEAGPRQRGGDRSRVVAELGLEVGRQQ